MSPMLANPNERNAFLASYCVELLGRMPKVQSASPAPSAVPLASVESEPEGAIAPPETLLPGEYCRKTRTLVELYVMQRARYSVRSAAGRLERANWLLGFGPDYELVSRDILADPSADPEAQGQRLAQAVMAVMRLHEDELSAQKMAPQ